MKILNTILVISFLASVSFACKKSSTEDTGNADGKVIITGEVLNPQSQEVILEKIVDNQLEALDTFNMGEDNKFKFTVDVSEPDYYRINFGGFQKRILILNDKDLHIVAGGSGMNDKFDVTGSVEMDQIATIENLVDSLNEKMVALSSDYSEAQQSGDAEKVKAITDQYQSLREQQQEAIKEHIKTMEPSLAVISALSFLSMDDNLDFIEEQFNKVEAKYPNSKHVKDFKEQLQNTKQLAVGQEAPDIKLPNPEGDTVALSSLRGNVVLIDFWAAWCGPCRKENPNVVKMYKEYKDKGFEIYGVSLDRSRDAWVKAIKDDGLIWTQVSDLQYFDSKAAELYNVQAIPFTVLLDREGKIIDKNLRGKALEDKLKEILD